MANQHINKTVAPKMATGSPLPASNIRVKRPIIEFMLAYFLPDWRSPKKRYIAILFSSHLNRNSRSCIIWGRFEFGFWVVGESLQRLALGSGVGGGSGHNWDGWSQGSWSKKERPRIGLIKRMNVWGKLFNSKTQPEGNCNFSEIQTTGNICKYNGHWGWLEKTWT